MSSRKYQRSKRTRSRSQYPARLQARGLSKAPVMPTLESLRKLQASRYKQTGSVFPHA